MRQVKRSHTPVPLISAPSISLPGDTHPNLEAHRDKSWGTHAHVTLRSYVSVHAGGLTVRQSLPPTEQAWLSLSFTTSLIDLLIIFFTGDPPCRGSKAITLFYSVLFCSVLNIWRLKDQFTKSQKQHIFPPNPCCMQTNLIFFTGFEI